MVQSRARFIANDVRSKHDPDARKETQAFRSLNTQGSELGKRRLLDKLLEGVQKKEKDTANGGSTAALEPSKDLESSSTSALATADASRGNRAEDLASLSPCRPNKDHLDDAGDVDSVHSDEDPWDNIDGDDLDYPAEEELPTLSSVRDFRVRSNAFNTLRKGLYTFVYPPAPYKRHFQDSADSLDILKPIDVSPQDSNSAAAHITTPKTEDSMIHTSLSLPETDREIIAYSFARQDPAAEADVDVTTSVSGTSCC